MADFLFEIGLEEVPARMIETAQMEMGKRVLNMLSAHRLINLEGLIKWTSNGGLEIEGIQISFTFATPRRLAVLVKGVLLTQRDSAENLTGPATKIAYKDGVLTAAGLAFAKKSGVGVEELRVVETPKGEYVAATSIKRGKPAAEVIAAELPKELAAIYWAKNMYWRAGKPERFVRPVRWMVGLLGTEVVPVEFGGYTAGRETFGHRVLFGAGPIELGEPAEYVESLTNGFVMADVELRRHTIRKSLDRVCRTATGTRWREDHALVDKMTHMTEWPSVILGSFEREYLSLPEEVLVTVMRDHQNYFAVEDGEGKLAPHFLAVLNTVADEAGEAIIRHGNERVLRARFNDARFFWEFDQRVPLLERRELLKRVIFQKTIGTYWDKAANILGIARQLKVRSFKEGLIFNSYEENALDQAALLAKTDLTTELVKEFPELQGMVGGLYARRQGFAEEISEIIYWQYEPKTASDRIPPSPVSQLLGLADRIGTVVDMIAIGNLPTGSKDPFALRRSANAIVRILAEGSIPLKLSQVLEAGIVESSFAKASVTQEDCASFLTERLEFYLREAKEQTYDVVTAVLAVGSDDVRDVVARAQAVSAVRESSDFTAVVVAFKRMRNILAQGIEKKYEVASFDEMMFDTRSDSDFWSAVQEAGTGFKQNCDRKEYVEALSILAGLRDPIDNYFLETMVMVDDPSLRANRLGMLRYLLTTFMRIADFSEIVVAG